MPKRREFSAEERRNLASKGMAMPDGSYPIVTVEDLRNAIAAFGRAKNPAATKRHIIKRAKALGRTDLLPEAWGSRSAGDDEWAFRLFHHQLTDPDAARQSLESGASEGNADVLVAVYDIPDTHVAVGNVERQIIDRGAFDGFAQRMEAEDGVRPLFLDHGDFMAGYSKSQLMIGSARNFRSVNEGLIFRGRWNLEVQAAREAFSQLVFEPDIWQFSFRNLLSDEVHSRGADGFEHIVEFKNMSEASQVVWGAQGETGVLAETIAARLGNPDFRTYLAEVIEEILARGEGGDPDPDPEPDPEPEPAPVGSLINSGSVGKTFEAATMLANRGALALELRDDAESRQVLKDLLEEAERPDPVTDFMSQVWKGFRATS